MKKSQKKIVVVIVSFVIVLIQQHFFNEPRQNIADGEIINTKLVRVVDGDTLILSIDGQDERVRLIGMDAPESVRPGYPVECFGREASEYALEILKNKSLSIKLDYSQDTHDRFGRLLVYLFVNGDNFATHMITAGYARQYTFEDKKYFYQEDFRKAEFNAKKEKKGLWADGVCDDK